MNLIDKVKCAIHRHTIDEHPACFAQGLVIDKREDQTIPWYKEDGFKIGILDIEADGLAANWNTMLSWAIKQKDGDVVCDVITKRELFNGTVDKNLVTSLVDEMKKYRIIIGYYSTGYDIPFVRAKALHYNLDFPGYGEVYHFDVYYTVREKLGIKGKGLDSACEYLNIPGKTPLDREIWRLAKYGNKEALQEVVNHNVKDTEITEKLFDKIAFTRKWTKRSI
jgi:uncharacterized protein YprB with RNaseH-like and TPR domain